MNRFVLDEKGKACPAPVIESKNRLANMDPGEELEVVVDNSIAVENIVKMATQLKFEHAWEQTAQNEYRIVIIKGEKAAEESPAANGSGGGDLVVAVEAETMGRGNDVLGKVLIKGFLYALTELEELPKTVLFYNGGAKLTAEGSESLEDLEFLQSQGVEILTCGTCIDYLELDKTPKVGSVTNMYSIVQVMTMAGRLVKP